MKHLAIVIVFYRPTQEMIIKTERLSEEFPVYVADNSDACVEISSRINYFPLYGNRGIAEAQNVAITKAINDGVDYILLLDQDSHLLSHDARKLAETFEKLQLKDEKIAAIGPYPINISEGKPYKTSLRHTVEKNAMVETLIASGTLIDVEAIRTVGMMDSSLYIDYVDFEWCWRVRDYGYHLYMTREVELLHQVGKGSLSFCGMTFILSAPFRYYYQYRNFLWLASRKYVPLKWKLNTAAHLLFQFILFLFHRLYKGNRKSILIKSLKGMKDGIR